MRDTPDTQSVDQSTPQTDRRQFVAQDATNRVYAAYNDAKAIYQRYPPAIDEPAQRLGLRAPIRVPCYTCT